MVLGVVALFVFGSISDRAGSPEPAPSDHEAAPAGAAESIDVNDPAGSFTLVAVGDILLDRRVGERISAEGWEAPFAEAAPLLGSADIAFANLECPASYLGSPFPGKPPIVTFRADPGALFGIKKAGIDIVSLANNHMNDFGPAALVETMLALDLLGIARSGAGRNGTEARRPAVLTAGAGRVAFLAYAEPGWSVVGADDGPGVALFDASNAVSDIAAAAEISDFVLVSLHWGEEHKGFPRERDRELARALVDAGADAVLGHHPHVLQGMEFHRGSPILYSLGNFVFDMVSPKTYESAAAEIRFSQAGPTTVTFIPLRIDARTFAPSIAKGEDAEKIGKLIRDRCALLGSPSLIRSDGRVVLAP